MPMGSPFLTCPHCSFPVPLNEGKVLRCPRCRDPVWLCHGCGLPRPVTSLRCPDSSCDGHGARWTIAAAGGGEGWPVSGGGGHRACRPTRSFSRARLAWEAAPLIGGHDFYGPVHSDGIVCLVSTAGHCTLFAESGLPVAPSHRAPGATAWPLPLREGDVTGGRMVTAPPVFLDRIVLGLSDGELVQVDPESLVVESLARVHDTVTQVLPRRRGWAVVTMDHSLVILGPGGSIEASFSPDDVREMARGDGGDAEIPAVLRTLEAVAMGDDVILPWIVPLGSQEATCLVKFDGSSMEFEAAGWIAERMSTAAVAGEHLILFGEHVGFRVSLEDLCRAPGSLPRWVVCEGFPLPCLPAHGPTLCDDGRFACTDLDTGALYCFEPASRGSVARFEGVGPRPRQTRVMPSPPHFVFACDDFVYLDGAPISERLVGMAHTDLSCVNGRVFVVTSRPGGLYAFDVS